MSINTDQRKVLNKIVETTLRRKSDQLCNENHEKAGKMKLSEAKKNQKAGNKLFAEMTALLKRKEAIKKEGHELGFEIRIHGYSDQECSMQAELNRKLREKIDKEWDEKKEALRDVELKMTAKVWSLEADFEAILKSIKKELAKI